MVFDQVLEELDQKGSVEIAKYDIFKKFLVVFFMDPDFYRLDPDFWPIRIRTQEKKSVPDPDKRTRIRNTSLKGKKVQNLLGGTNWVKFLVPIGNTQRGIFCVRWT